MKRFIGTRDDEEEIALSWYNCFSWSPDPNIYIWLEKTCEGRWCIPSHYKQWRWNGIYFELENDYVLFVLTWK